MRYFIITDSHDTQMGMRLSGIEGVLVSGKNEVQAAIEKALDDPTIGVLLITERCAALCPALVGELKLTLQTPLLVEIPDRHGTTRGADSITRHIRESIGIKI
ncbi:V-type ATP synthase subunit F [Oscillospiraceae bacterium OttesenSCG-928-F05]|nr:V-type ATP synthase subunit F [Oscillospiraceae bacterium OttesenSCG-928-F05]